MLLARSVRNGPKMGSRKEEWERDWDHEWLFEWPDEERGGRRTLPEKVRPEKPWRRKRTETRTAVQMHKFSLIFHFLLRI
jgi:hypothetical protein